jgi:hypothetical protein
MKKIKNTGFVVLTKGILMVLLGIVHIIAIFVFVQNDVKNQMTPQMLREFILWFAVGGIFFIFIGIIDLISYEGIRKRMYWAWKTSFSSAAICCLAAPIGIAVFKEGPPFLILFLGLLEIIPLVLYKKEFNY